MLRSTTLVVAAALALTGCARLSESPVNPLNWFGPSAPAAPAAGQSLLPAGGVVAVVDNRAPVTVTGVEVARTDDGALVTATGVAPAPGYFNAQLARVGIEGTTLVLRFVAEAPATPVGGAREITAATQVSTATLAGVTGVRVEGAGGALSAGF